MPGLRLAIVCWIATGIVGLATAEPINPFSGQAQADLGHSGAKLIVTSTAVPHTPASDHRVVTLVMPDGRRRVATIKNDDGGELGENALNLYFAGKNHFQLLSNKDCLDIDAIGAKLQSCPVVPPCNPGLPAGSAFLGRFDYMNGFDSPRRAFVYRFRFLPFYDANCG